MSKTQMKKVINFANALPCCASDGAVGKAFTSNCPDPGSSPITGFELKAPAITCNCQERENNSKIKQIFKTTYISPTRAISPPYARILTQVWILSKVKLEYGWNGTLPNRRGSSSASEDSASVTALPKTNISIAGNSKALSKLKISIFVLKAITSITIDIWFKNGVFTYYKSIFLNLLQYISGDTAAVGTAFFQTDKSLCKNYFSKS